MQHLFSKNNLWYFIAALLAVHMYSFPFVVVPVLDSTGPSWLGLDVSWHMTLNHAVLQHWSWGKDIVYTYGPFSFLATRIGYGVSRWVFLFFDVFLVANYFFLFKDFIRAAEDKLIAVLTLFGITVLVHAFPGADLSWVLAVFIYYWMYKTYHTPKLSYFFVLITLVALSFFIKLNTAISGITFFYIHLASLIITKKIKPMPAAIAGGLPPVLIAALCLIFHVSFFDYLGTVPEIVRGYNDVMKLHEPHPETEQNLNVLFWMVAMLYSIYTVLLTSERKFSQLFFAAIGFAYILVLRKQCIIRNDLYHLSAFFPYATLLLTYGNFSGLSPKGQKFMSLGTLVVMITALAYNESQVPLNFSFMNRYTNSYEYLKEFRHYNETTGLHQRDKRYLPANVLHKIGNSTIDVFPWDSEYLLENKLNYTPRPVFQSFSAYTEKLQQINYDHYVKHAPQFILYDYDAIDGRYPFNDEMMLNFFITKNYTLADSFTSNERKRLLLQKKPQTQSVATVKLRDTVVTLNSEIPVQGAWFLKIYLHNNRKGTVEQLWNKSHGITLHMMRGNGNWVQYSTADELLKSGVFVRRWVNETNDIVKYIHGENNLDEIVKIRIEADSPKYYDPEINISYFSMK